MGERELILKLRQIAIKECKYFCELQNLSKYEKKCEERLGG